MSDRATGFPFLSLQDWVAFLDEQGDLRRNPREMSLKGDFGLVSKGIAENNGPAVLHENVVGYPDWRICSEILTTPQRQAWAMGLPLENLGPNITEVLRSGERRKPTVVAGGPCKEVKFLGDDIDLTDIPIPYAGVFENPPYFSSAISVIKDLESDWYNLAIRRCQLKGQRKLNELVLMNQHEGQIFRKYVWANKPMPIALVVGADPLFYLLSVTPAAAKESEWDFWAAFTGEPLKVVKCETNDLFVPATAEIVIEGMIDPVEREFEGPFSEFPGYYSGCYDAVKVRVNAVTMRTNPIYYYLYMGREPNEGINMMHVMSSAVTTAQLQALVPEVKDVNMISTWAFTTAVSIDKRAVKDGIVEKVAMAMKAVKGGTNVKNLLIFDDNIDVRNLGEVLWAFSVKFQPARDIFMFRKCITSALDPSCPSLGYGPGVTSVAVYDCTEPGPPHDEPYRREVALPPLSNTALAVLKDMGLTVSPRSHAAVQFEGE
ncbi:MAG: UbiD family decarboxylase [Chloroflexi bacterium]|nr:UbiD family decarboxylase [Chloroflexota bacterium]